MIIFAAPEYLYLLWLTLPAAALIIWSQLRWRKKRILLGDAVQHNKILPGIILKNSLWSSSLSLLGISLWMIAMAQPQYGSQLESSEKSVTDIFLAIDVSRSMQAEDIKPNRLERTKLFAANLLEDIGSERISIITFAGHAYMNMPLTTDMAATKMILESIDENTASTQGTAIGEAIKLMTASVEELELQGRAMILLTDGENHEPSAVEAASAASKLQVTIYPVGVGTEKGSKIPTHSRTGSPFLLDSDGSVVISKYNPQLLQDIATATGGTAYNMLGGNNVIKDIKEKIAQLDSRILAEETFEVKRDFFTYLIFAGIFCLISGLYVDNFYKQTGNA